MLYLTIAFAAGLAAALNPYVVRGASYVVLPVLIGALVLQRRAAVAAACGVMLVAGVVWGAAALREQRASCAGQHARAAIVRLTDPAPGAGGVVEVRELDGVPRGRGALRDRVAERSRRLFGARAPLVDALVIARRAELDAGLRERYTRSGLAHLLSISGLHVGFFAAWLNVLLARLRLGARARFVAGTGVMLAYVWLLGFPEIGRAH